MKRPFYGNHTHGLFAVLFAGTEVHRMNCMFSQTVNHRRMEALYLI